MAVSFFTLARIPGHAAAVLAGVALALGTAMAAVTLGVTPDGWAWAEGGADARDEAQWTELRARHNLVLLAANRTADAALAGVQVRITDLEHHRAFERVLSGSWLLVSLPAGRYEVEARLRGQTQRQPLLVEPGAPQQMLVFYFDGAGAPAAD